MNLEKISNDFMELASEQRLDIILKLSQQKLSLSKLSDLLNATKPEVHRNVNRLLNAELIEKNTDGSYSLTTSGSAFLTQFSSFYFIIENKKYFANHTLRHLEQKFIQRLGALTERKQINGFVRVLEKWKKIHENAQEYIYNILSEVPYSGDIIDVITLKLKNNIQIRSIFTENAVIPEERTKIFHEKGFQKYVQNGTLERRIKKNVGATVLVTEKESAVFFSNLNGIPDLSTMFTSIDPDFHDWCYDYFEWCWKNSTIFQESRLTS